MKGTLQQKPQRPHSVWTGAVIWGYLGLALRLMVAGAGFVHRTSFRIAIEPQKFGNRNR
jgi:hypothetical protein